MSLDEDHEVPAFSVVVPVAARDSDMVSRSLPAYLALEAKEVLVCVDSPLDPNLTARIRAAAKGNPKLRIVEVEPDSSWRFRQALVRRSGFRAAVNDRILTGDVDVVVNRNVLAAVKLVGRDNVGVVNLQKEMRSGLGDVMANWTRRVVRILKRESFWSGLYALYRPYWLDTEREQDAKSIPHPLDHGVIDEEDDFYVPLARKGRLSTPPYLGDDTMLKRAMLTKHKVLSLPNVGGVEVRQETDRRPGFQTRQAIWLYTDGRSFPYMIPKSILYARGRMLGTYMHLMRRRSGTAHLAKAIATSPFILLRFAEGTALRKAGVRARAYKL